MEKSSKKRTSKIWKLFKRLGLGYAKCLLCKRILSHKTSITNLKRHLRIKHGEMAEEFLGPPNPPGQSKKDVTPGVLIALVKMYPCIWDKGNTSYDDAHLKNSAWHTVAAALCPMEDRNIAASRLSQQFDRLANEFFLKGQSCAYYRDLLFLTTSLSHNTTTDTTIFPKVDIKTEYVDNGQEHENEQGPSEEPPEINGGATEEQPLAGDLHRSPPPPAVSVRENDSSSSFNLQITDVCENTLFLLSMVEEMRKIPGANQLTFKKELFTLFEQLVVKHSK